MARAFHGAGARVAAAGRPGPTLDAVAAEIGAVSVSLNLLDMVGIEKVFADHPAFDHVVVAAAATRTGPVADLPLEDAMASMESKFWGGHCQLKCTCG